MPNKPSCILRALHVYEGSSTQEEAKSNKEKRTRDKPDQKWAHKPILVPFLLENGKTVKTFELFRYILTATVKKYPEEGPRDSWKKFW